MNNLPPKKSSPNVTFSFPQFADHEPHTERRSRHAARRNQHPAHPERRSHLACDSPQKSCLSTFTPPKSPGCPILRAFCEGWDVHPPPATEPLLVPLPRPFWFSPAKYSLPSPKQNACPILRAFCQGWEVHRQHRQIPPSNSTNPQTHPQKLSSSNQPQVANRKIHPPLLSLLHRWPPRPNQPAPPP